MHIGLLGGLEVRDADDSDVVVAGAKLRALLAVLALQVGRVVPTDQLIDALWGDDPPSGVRNGLQGLASKLRRALGSTDIVTMRGGGYALELPAEAIDVHRYEELIERAQVAIAAGDRGRAVALLTEADSLWRGSALADFAFDDFAVPAISRLSELRLGAIEERLDIELGLGRHLGAIVELEGLVAEHPLRERPRGLLMVALYRAGRQADALRVFQEGRSILRDELGLEPGPELRRLEAAVLAQEPSLDAPAGTDDRAQRQSAIPESLTSLIGRDEELRDVTRLLVEHRFVTLVGPGGVGKTRLATEGARAMSRVLADGGCLVELAHVGDPSGVRDAIASALDVPDSSRLADMVGDREILLLLDNCEHVIDTAAEVAEDLLRRCPRLRLLATSREALRVGGETVWPVPPLATGDAEQLFVTRARAAGAPLDVSDERLPLISDICLRLDGMPLAIELAAARTRAFPLEQISSRLNDRFRLLTGGSRTALPRQQTLRAVVDWSYDLLFDDEQRVFERLSVFAGGCDLATAEVVCADETLVADDLEDIIHALVDKSLVVAERRGTEVRFTQLQTLAHYGREKLAERGEAERVRDAMAAHYSRLCAGSAAAYTGAHQHAWLTAIDQEHDNLRSALEWVVANGDAETALGIAGGASWTHWMAGTFTEGKRWVDEAFACASASASDREVDESTRALALMGRGLMNFLSGLPANSDADLAEALVIFRGRNEVDALALTYSFWAEFPHVVGDIEEARRRRLEVLAFYESLPDEPFSIAARAYSAAMLGIFDGDLEAAEARYREAAAGFSEGNRPVMRTVCLGMMADFDERAGRFRAAIEELDEAVELTGSLGLRSFNGSLLSRLAWVLLQDSDVARAEIVNRRAVDVGRRLRSVSVLFLALTGAALLHRHHGRNGDAVAAATEALELYRVGWPRRFGNRIDPELETRSAAAVCCAVLGIVAAEEGDCMRAARLLGQADRLRGDVGAPVTALQHDEIDRARDAAVLALGADGFVAAFEQGRQSELGPLVMAR
jgi:predicted ATPase/DNA-binding SARP family transcriptional activator